MNSRELAQFAAALTGDTSVINIGSGQIYKDVGGNVGIGGIPASGFKQENFGSSVATPATTSLQLSLRELGNVTALNFIAANEGGTLVQRVFSSTSLALGTNATERLRIDSAGNVGIGTNDPSGHRLRLLAEPTIFGDARTSFAIADSSAVSSGMGGGISFTSPSTTGGAPTVVFANIKGIRENAIDNSFLGALVISTRNGATPIERLRIDSAGNLGLGVVPSAWGGVFRAIDVGVNGAVSGTTSLGLGSNYYNDGTTNRYKGTGAAIQIALNNSGNLTFSNAPSGAAGNPITFTQAMTLTNGGQLLVGTTNGVAGAKLKVQEGFIGINNLGAGLSNQDLGRIGAYNVNATTGGLTFATSDNNVVGERARITSGGYFKASNTGVYGNVAGVGDFSANAVHVFQTNAAGSATVFAITDQTNGASGGYVSAVPSGSVGYHFQGRVNNANTYQINANGSGGQVSDQNFKTNITPASPKLDDLMQVEVVNYNWKEETGLGDQKEIGVIAQQLETIFPALVQTTTNEDGTEQKMVKYSVLTPILVKALQEANTKIESLEARLTAAGL